MEFGSSFAILFRTEMMVKMEEVGRLVDMLDIDRPVLAIIPPIEIDHKIARCQRRSLNWWTALISLCEKMCCGFSFSFLSLLFSEGREEKKIWMLAVL